MNTSAQGERQLVRTLSTSQEVAQEPPSKACVRSPLALVIRAALRDAVAAPTVFDALDICGDALRRIRGNLPEFSVPTVKSKPAAPAKRVEEDCHV
ncbi:MAG: hypothetical protein WDN30_07680 [Pararobbsia sp.]